MVKPGEQSESVWTLHRHEQLLLRVLLDLLSSYHTDYIAEVTYVNRVLAFIFATDDSFELRQDVSGDFSILCRCDLATGTMAATETYKDHQGWLKGLRSNM